MPNVVSKRSLTCAGLVLWGGVLHGLPAVGDIPAIERDRPIQIVALGDSITRGSGFGYGNYRRPLQAMLYRAGYKCVFVGANQEQSFNYAGPDPQQNFKPYQPQHEGYGGFRIDQIAGDSPVRDDGGVAYAGLTRSLVSDNPGAILLMLGTNDVTQAYDPGSSPAANNVNFASDAAGRIAGLVDHIFRLKPNVILLMASIPPLADAAREQRAKAYNRYLPQIVLANRRLGRKIYFVDMNAAITASDVSADGVHPTTLGYDKMAGAWFLSLTGKRAPTPTVPPVSSGPGRLSQRNVFHPSLPIVVSNIFHSAAFAPANLIDGSAKAFVFGQATVERVSISGFNSGISRLRFFDAPSYMGRTPGIVTIYYSSAATSSLQPRDYTKEGTHALAATGYGYPNAVSPPVHPLPGEPASQPNARIGFCDIAGLKIPPGTRGVLLDFSKRGGDGDGLTEIQAFSGHESR